MTATESDAAPRSGRRATRHGDSRRDELVHAASELFADRGYRDTSIAQVAERVGVTQQALLYYFGSKAGLLDAVIDDRDGAAVEFAEQLAAVGGAEALRRLPGAARRNVADPYLARLFAVLVAENLSPESIAHEHFVQRYRHLREIVAGLIADGQRDGVFAADPEPQLLATEILATIDGLNTQWLLDPEVDLVAASEQWAAGLAERLAPRRPTARDARS